MAEAKPGAGVLIERQGDAERRVRYHIVSLPRVQLLGPY